MLINIMASTPSRSSVQTLKEASLQLILAAASDVDSNAERSSSEYPERFGPSFRDQSSAFTFLMSVL